MGEGSKPEVGAKLVLDDEATEALHKLHEGFEGVSEKVHETAHEMAGFAKQTLAVAAGFQLDRGIDTIKEMGEEFFHAAQEAGSLTKELANVLSENDRTGKSFSELKEEAGELREHLEGVAIATGTASHDLVDAFADIGERSGKSSEEVSKMVETMAMAGKGIQGGLGGLTQAYRDLESGIVRPKNEIVLLLKQSGLVAGSTRDIAKGMSQLMEKNPAKAFELADQAIARMAAKMKDAPLGFGAVVNSLKDIREQLFATVGEPMIRAIVGPLRQLREYLVANKERFGEMAKELGERVGEWVKKAAEMVQEGFEYLKSHAQEIQEAISEGARLLKEAVGFVVEHKDAIRDLLLARMGANLLEKGAGVASGVAGAAKVASGVMGAGAPLLGIEGAAVGSAAALGAVTIGLAGLAATAWAAKTIYDDVSKFNEQDSNARMDALKKAAETGEASREELQHWRDALVAAHPEIATMANHLMDMANAARESREAQEREAHAAGAQLLHAQGNAAAVKLFHDEFAKMSAAHNQAQMQYLASLLFANGEIMDAMHKAGVDLTDVGGDLAKAVAAIHDPSAGSRAAEIEGIVEEQKKAAASGATKMTTFDFRNSTFHMTQDFRDQDPDRILLMFRKDLSSAATTRTQSRFANPFGL